MRVLPTSWAPPAGVHGSGLWFQSDVKPSRGAHLRHFRGSTTTNYLARILLPSPTIGVHSRVPFEVEEEKMNGVARGYSLHAFLAAIALTLPSCGTLPTDLGLEREGEIGSGPGESTEASSGCPGSLGNKRVLVDASHDGGVWWFPQTWPFDPGQDHQGRALADHLRGCGYTVDELGRGTVVTEALLEGYGIVIRAGKFGTYLPSELDAYEGLLSSETTLILLSEFLREGQIDPVAERLGLQFRGTHGGVVTDLEAHPITYGVELIFYTAGSGLHDFDASKVTVLGRLDGVPVMGLLHGYPAKVFFMGDTNSLLGVPQPLVANLMAWGF